MGMLWQNLPTSLSVSESTGRLKSMQLFLLTVSTDLIIYIQYTKEDNIESTVNIYIFSNTVNNIL